MATSYRMGGGSNGLARIADHPYKPDHRADYRTRRTIKGVPAKWRPVWDELARRMYDGSADALDFAYEGGRFIVRPFDAPGPRSAGWTEYKDPAEALAALGVAAAAPAKRAPAKRTSAPAAAPAPVPAPAAPAPAATDPRPCIVCAEPVVSGTSAVYVDGTARHATCAPAAPAAPAAGVDAFAPGNGSGVTFTPADGWKYGHATDVVDMVRPPVEVNSTERQSDLPEWAADYLGRLVYEAKRDYAAAWIAHRLTGAPMPVDPGAEWADKVRARVAKLERVAS